MTAPNVLMIDNYDSFTWNVVQYLWELGADVAVYRNDEITTDEISSAAPALLCSVSLQDLVRQLKRAFPSRRSSDSPVRSLFLVFA